MLLLGINILLFMFIVIVVKFKFNYLFLYNLDTAEKVSQGGRSRTRNLSCLCVMKKDTYGEKFMIISILLIRSF